MSINNTTKPERINSGSLALYYKDVEGTRMLSAEEERTLIQRYHKSKDPRAKDLIIKGALRYVIAEARKHPRSSANKSVLEDLIAAGNIGLLRALTKFDPDAGTRFLTYAGWWVRHEMREEARRIGIVHLPAHAIAKGVKTPITTEISENITEFPDPYHNASIINTQQSMLKLLDIAPLSIRETFIVKTCYGIQTAPKTLKQIGKVLDITGERVRQLRETALSKLRTTAVTHQINF